MLLTKAQCEKAQIEQTIFTESMAKSAYLWNLKRFLYRENL
jgi:hypothetical protein